MTEQEKEQQHLWNVFMRGWLDGSTHAILAESLKNSESIPIRTAYSNGFSSGLLKRVEAEREATSTYGYTPYGEDGKLIEGAYSSFVTLARPLKWIHDKAKLSLESNKGANNG